MIYCVEDDQAIRDLMIYALNSAGFEARGFCCGRDFFCALEEEKPRLVMLDIMLPNVNGFTLCQRIREKYTYPIIMLTAKDEETDKITGLTLGADDYVTKPFRPLELIARVKAQLRRYNKYTPMSMENEPVTILAYKKLILNTKTYECELDGELLSLTPTEFSILRILLENQGTVVTLEELFQRIWKDEYYSKNSSTITVHIRHLREKLKDTAEKPKYIKTIWGVGYKI